VIFCVHGCAYTALSWAPTARHLAARLGPSAAIVAMDLRGHGESRAANERDVSAATLASDVAAVATRVAESRDVFRSFPSVSVSAAAKSAPPRLVLVGHSLGGAIVARVAAGTALANVAGLVLVDAAESAAREAIPRMEASARRESEASSLARQSRPLGFDALRDVVEWATRTRQTLDVASAAISYPSQLAACDGTEDSATHRWRWRVDLGATARFWRGWFEGLTATFLSDALRETPKLLVLAGLDRVAEDPEMLVAQMRGAFQTVLIPEAGHACHEDRPAEVADALASFAERNSRARRSK
jgi:protein phosphatase methylesterase 1